VNKELRQDLEGLTGYIFENEFEDMVYCLINEPLYVEEGIITEENSERLTELNLGDQKEFRIASDIVEKCCENLNNRHIYALAYRLWKNLKHFSL